MKTTAVVESLSYYKTNVLFQRIPAYFKVVQMCSVLLYLNVYIIILHLCKVFCSLQSCFVWILVILEIIKVYFHSSASYHLVDLQQWPIYSSMLSLYSVSSTKFHYVMKTTYFLLVNMFVYIYINLIIYSCVAMCKWTNRWRSCDHTSISVFQYYQSFLSSPYLLIHDNWQVYTFVLTNHTCTLHIWLENHYHLTVLSWLNLYMCDNCTLHNKCKSIRSCHYVMFVKLYNHAPHVHCFVGLLVALWTILSLMPTTSHPKAIGGVC